MKKQLEIEKRSNEFLRKQTEQERNRTRAEKAAKTRFKKKLERVKNGVCPCCNRSFANLHNHMKSQHPDYLKEG